MTTWLVCGGRDFCRQDIVDRELSRIANERGAPSKVVHGAAAGADTCGAIWAQRDPSIEVVAVPANWSIGRLAGPLRNQRMLDEHEPDLVIAFPRMSGRIGAGTADMLRRARDAGVEVIEVRA